jgi:hypothetical protein
VLKLGMDTEKRDPIACRIIDGLDGTVAVADLCDIDPGAVSQWRKNGIPRPRIQFLRLARPDFNWASVPATYAIRQPRKPREAV